MQLPVETYECGDTVPIQNSMRADEYALTRPDDYTDKNKFYEEPMTPALLHIFPYKLGPRLTTFATYDRPHVRPQKK
jgi:hypothetical protein